MLNSNKNKKYTLLEFIASLSRENKDLATVTIFDGCIASQPSASFLDIPSEPERTTMHWCQSRSLVREVTNKNNPKKQTKPHVWSVIDSQWKGLCSSSFEGWFVSWYQSNTDTHMRRVGCRCKANEHEHISQLTSQDWRINCAVIS